MCPKCEEGELRRIRFKADGKIAYACNTCDSLWFESEEKNASTAHTLSAFADAKGLEYSFDDVDDIDQEHQKLIDKKEDTA